MEKEENMEKEVLIFLSGKSEEDLLLFYGGKKWTLCSSMVGSRTFGSSMVGRVFICGEGGEPFMVDVGGPSVPL